MIFLPQLGEKHLSISVRNIQRVENGVSQAFRSLGIRNIHQAKVEIVGRCQDESLFRAFGECSSSGASTVLIRPVRPRPFRSPLQRGLAVVETGLCVGHVWRRISITLWTGRRSLTMLFRRMSASFVLFALPKLVQKAFAVALFPARGAIVTRLTIGRIERCSAAIFRCLSSPIFVELIRIEGGFGTGAS